MTVVSNVIKIIYLKILNYMVLRIKSTIIIKNNVNIAKAMKVTSISLVIVDFVNVRFVKNYQ